MSDASQLIAQQMAAAGVNPSELTPIGSVTKTYVDTQDAALLAGIQSAAGVGAAAQQTANTANSTAGSALSAASLAQSSANTATSTADSALQTASTALTNANSAQGVAGQANSTATATQGNLNTHASDTVIHVTQSDRDRWDAGGGGGASGPSFGKVNDIQSATANDTITFAAGTGMAVSTDPVTKTVTYTAQGSSAPGAHAATHLPGGSDPIQTATTTQFGLTQLNDAINSTSTTQAGTANGVRKAYDRGSNALTVAQTAATTTAPGRVQLNDTNTSTATDQALTANAGRVAYEEATRLGSTTQVGRVQMYDGIDSNSTTLAATANAVRLAAQSGGGGGVTIGTTSAVTYYVDGTAGNDTTGTGTQAAPFKTIQKSVDALWNLCKGKLNHSCDIRTQAGQTFAEDVNVSGFWGGGKLTITGNYTGTTTATVRSMTFSGNTCEILALYFVINTTTDIGVRVLVCASVRISNFSMTTAVNATGVLAQYSQVYLINTTISNRTTAIFSTSLATILINTNAGVGNVTVLSASQGGTIIKAGGTQPTGSTAESQNTGGLIR